MFKQLLQVCKVIYLYIDDKTPDRVIWWQQKLDYKPKHATNLICQLTVPRANASIRLSSLQFTVPSNWNELHSNTEVDIFMSTAPCFYWYSRW